MTAQIVSRRIAAIHAATPALEFLTASPQARRQNEPGVANFLYGNPQRDAAARIRGSAPALEHAQDKDWFAYKINDPKAQAVVATVLRERRNVPFDPDDIFLTNGATGGLSVALGAVVDPGDEVVFISPPWFFYEAFIVGYRRHPGARAGQSGHLRP